MSEILHDQPGAGAMQQAMNCWWSIDKRFAQADQRFEEINRRMDLFMKWRFGTALTLAGVLIAAIRLF